MLTGPVSRSDSRVCGVGRVPYACFQPGPGGPYGAAASPADSSYPSAQRSVAVLLAPGLGAQGGESTSAGRGVAADVEDSSDLEESKYV